MDWVDQHRNVIIFLLIRHDKPILYYNNVDFIGIQANRRDIRIVVNSVIID